MAKKYTGIDAKAYTLPLGSMFVMLTLALATVFFNQNSMDNRSKADTGVYPTITPFFSPTATASPTALPTPTRTPTPIATACLPYQSSNYTRAECLSRNGIYENGCCYIPKPQVIPLEMTYSQPNGKSCRDVCSAYKDPYYPTNYSYICKDVGVDYGATDNQFYGANGIECDPVFDPWTTPQCYCGGEPANCNTRLVTYGTCIERSTDKQYNMEYVRCLCEAK